MLDVERLHQLKAKRKKRKISIGKYKSNDANEKFIHLHRLSGSLDYAANDLNIFWLLSGILARYILEERDHPFCILAWFWAIENVARRAIVKACRAPGSCRCYTVMPASFFSRQTALYGFILSWRKVYYEAHLSSSLDLFCAFPFSSFLSFGLSTFPPDWRKWEVR
jgi:hypothetical protein